MSDCRLYPFRPDGRARQLVDRLCGGVMERGLRCRCRQQLAPGLVGRFRLCLWPGNPYQGTGRRGPGRAAGAGVPVAGAGVRAAAPGGLGCVYRAGAGGGRSLVHRNGHPGAELSQGVCLEEPRLALRASVHSRAALVVLSSGVDRADLSVVVVVAGARLFPGNARSRGGAAAHARARFYHAEPDLVGALLLRVRVEIAAVYAAGHGAAGVAAGRVPGCALAATREKRQLRLGPLRALVAALDRERDAAGGGRLCPGHLAA